MPVLSFCTNHVFSYLFLRIVFEMYQGIVYNETVVSRKGGHWIE